MEYVGTDPVESVVFAAVPLRDLERVTTGVVAGAGSIVVGAAAIRI